MRVEVWLLICFAEATCIAMCLQRILFVRSLFRCWFVVCVFVVLLFLFRLLVRYVSLDAIVDLTAAFIRPTSFAPKVCACVCVCVCVCVCANA